MNHPINLQYKMGNFSNLDRWIINHLSDGMAPKPCSDALIQSPRLVQEGTWAPTSRAPSSIRLFTDVVGPATLLSSSFFYLLLHLDRRLLTKLRARLDALDTSNHPETGRRHPVEPRQPAGRTFVVGFLLMPKLHSPEVTVEDDKWAWGVGWVWSDDVQGLFRLFSSSSYSGWQGRIGTPW